MKLDAALVEQMKQTAKQYPIKAGDMASALCLQADIEFDGHNLNIMLTNDSIDELLVWHLSVGNANHTPTTPEVSQKVVEMFFPAPYKLLPKWAFPPEMQFMDQYIKIIES